MSAPERAGGVGAGVVVEPDVLARDLAALVRTQSPTGEERAALAWLARRAQELAHAVDERVRIDEVAAVARIIAAVVACPTT